MAEGVGPVTGRVNARIFSPRILFWLGFFVLLQFFWFGVTEGWTADERVSDLTVKTAPQGEILVSASLLQPMQGKAANDIQHGIPKDLFYYVLLMKRQPAWFDEELLAKTIKYTIQYDVLKKQYRVHVRHETDAANSIVENFQEMVDLISKIDNVKIADVKMLKPKETYYVRVKAQMKA
ncbi:MAG TPA: DUF4390 domain-containing protein, partial [Nitrospiria bacterium]|nr:DUF4390 domain-containing protein [Nitrospiria bacterium]